LSATQWATGPAPDTGGARSWQEGAAKWSSFQAALRRYRLGDQDPCGLRGDQAGQIRARFQVPNTGKGFTGRIKRLGSLGVAGVAIERSDGPLVEAMLEADLRVVVVTPQQVKSLRSRYRASGAKSDPADAYLLADVLRTDATAWPRSPQTASRPRSCGRCRAPART
jgi:hypothetical protein